jgi:hypothetical protein
VIEAAGDDIYAALVAGGFKFEGNTGTEDNQKRALKVALTKNTAQFVKIGENFGLRSWYKMRAPRNGRKAGEETDSPGDSAPAEAGEATLPLDELPEEGAKAANP